MRRAIVEAVRVHCYCSSTEELREKIATAVLRAALGGETEGEWFIAGVASDSDLPTATHSSGFAVCRDMGRGLTEVAADGLSREQADLFANALNLARDLAGGGTDGE